MTSIFDRFESFAALPVIGELKVAYAKRRLLAEEAIKQLDKDFCPYLNKNLKTEYGHLYFTSFEARAKEPESFFKKLYLICKESAISNGITDELIKKHYDDIKDIAGSRFACPYEGDVIKSIKFFRDKLSEKGYAIKITDSDFLDKNLLENGDKSGYRAFHFYIKIPTPIDIYGKKELMLCEVQARSELQHVWAIKSHDLFYKNPNHSVSHENYVEKMKQISQHLRLADYLLNEIRDSVRNASDSEEDK